MIRRPPRSTPKPSSAASDVYKRELENRLNSVLGARPSTRQAQEDEEYVPTIAGAPVTIDNSNAPKASVDEDDALSYFQKLAND